MSQQYEILSFGIESEEEWNHLMDNVCDATENDMMTQENNFRKLIHQLISMLQHDETDRNIDSFFYDYIHMSLVCDVEWYSYIIYDILGLEAEKESDVLHKIDFLILIKKNFIKNYKVSFN